MNQPPHLWDLRNDEELKSLIEGLLKNRHQLAAYQVGTAVQCGWRHALHPGRSDVWGMALTGRVEALRDATERFWQSIKKGREAIYSFPAPTHSHLASPLTPFLTTLEVQS